MSIARLGRSAALALIVSTAASADDTKPTATGVVVDVDGRPVEGARVRLYRRIGRWERRHPVIEEMTTGPGGRYRFASPLTAPAQSPSRPLPPYLLLADRPGLAVGWRTIPLGASAFQGDITLTAPDIRSVRIVDEAGRPAEGAKVTIYAMGDPASSSPLFRDDFDWLLPGDGPLTAITGPDGRASFAQIPRTNASFLAMKPGFAETFGFHGRETIRLTPSAALSGKVTGPDGRPLSGVKVVLKADFMWDFYHALTDAESRYRFDDLKAKGWDMSTWGPGKTGDGAYKLWIESDRLAIPTQSLTFEPGTRYALDLAAEQAGAIRVTLLEDGTTASVAGARLSGFESPPGGRRFDAVTDKDGRATFHAAAPAEIHISLVGPPPGVYLKDDLRRNPGAAKAVDFQGGETDLTLVMPPVSGRLVRVSGVCTRPDGSRVERATVHAVAVKGARAPGPGTLITGRRTDGLGQFAVEGLPGGHKFHLYAETEDRRLAATTTAQAPEKDGPAKPIPVALSPTVTVEYALTDGAGKPLASRKLRVAPKVSDDEFPLLHRAVETDAAGRLRLDGIVPGLSYHVSEEVPAGVPIVRQAGGRISHFDQVIVLAPAEGP